MAKTLSISSMQDITRSDLASAVFYELATGEGLRQVCVAGFAAEGLTLAKASALGEVVYAETSSIGFAAVLRVGSEMLTRVGTNSGNAEIVVAGTSRDAAERVNADFVAALRDPEPAADRLPVHFWANASGHPTRSRRSVHAPSWAEVRGNYGHVAQGALDELAVASEPGPGGLLLWHGEPGTGKSYALRALAREWREWCDIHFITDADAFLGSQSGYLVSALLRTPLPKERWRLIVLEDAGELLAADARAVAGQALSRLLNLTDGLLGAGLRAIVLVTTNEPLRRMHPAVVRAGRTWARVEFGLLTASEANVWLSERGSSERVESPVALADLYALADGRALGEHANFGFAA